MCVCQCLSLLCDRPCVLCVTSSTWAVEWKFYVQGQHNDSGHSCKCVQCDATSTSPSARSQIIDCPRPPPRSLPPLKKSRYSVHPQTTHTKTHIRLFAQAGRQGRPLEPHTYVPIYAIPKYRPICKSGRVFFHSRLLVVPKASWCTVIIEAQQHCE